MARVLKILGLMFLIKNVIALSEKNFLSIAKQLDLPVKILKSRVPNWKYVKSKKHFLKLYYFSVRNEIKGKKGIIYLPEYCCLLGNQLFQFCVAKILSIELNMQLKCPPIYGFPETYKYNDAIYESALDSVICTDSMSLTKINLNKSQNIILRGAFTDLSPQKKIKYRDLIRKWLRFEKVQNFNIHPNDLVIHIRIYSEIHDNIQNEKERRLLPFSYYEKILSSLKYNNVYICTNEPNHDYIKKFEKYNAIIKSSDSLDALMYEKKLSYEEINKINLEEFMFLSAFNVMIISYSTYSFWAAFLSNATEIFVPWDNSFMSLDYMKNWFSYESRYKYIPIYD